MVQGFLFGMDVNDPALKVPQDFEEYGWFGRTLCAMMPILAERYGTDALQAVCAEQKADETVMDFGKLKIAAIFENPYLQLKGNGVALAVQMSEEEYYVVGYQTSLSLIPGDAKNLDMLEYEEGEFVDGQWRRERRLNGDEAASFIISEPKLFRIRICTYND